jgi:membrane protein implicated in regulation of membrane protease activity
MKVIKAIYDFLVGDMIILVGVIIALLVLALINTVSALAPLRGATGFLLVVVVIAVLTATLYREAKGQR